MFVSGFIDPDSSMGSHGIHRLFFYSPTACGENFGVGHPSSITTWMSRWKLRSMVRISGLQPYYIPFISRLSPTDPNHWSQHFRNPWHWSQHFPTSGSRAVRDIHGEDLTVRLGVCTKQGHSACIRDHFGPTCCSLDLRETRELIFSFTLRTKDHPPNGRVTQNLYSKGVLGPQNSHFWWGQDS